jgi:hypothetical protein
MQTCKIGMQDAAGTPLCESANLLHPKPQANKATVTPTMHSIKKNPKNYMTGLLHAVTSAFNQ